MAKLRTFKFTRRCLWFCYRAQMTLCREALAKHFKPDTARLKAAKHIWITIYDHDPGPDAVKLTRIRTECSEYWTTDQCHIFIDTVDDYLSDLCPSETDTLWAEVEYHDDT